MVIVERDYEIVKAVTKWRFLLGRQIKEISGFSGQRAADRRLEKLLQGGYLTRKRHIYGIPGIYQVTEKGRKIFDIELGISNVRLDQVCHNIAVVDTAIFFVNHGLVAEGEKLQINFEDITTDKELRHKLGLNPMKHLPDYIFTCDSKKYCVEVELSLKNKATLEKNIKDNYSNYDYQIWIVPKHKKEIANRITEIISNYPGYTILFIEDIQKNATSSIGGKSV